MIKLILAFALSLTACDNLLVSHKEDEKVVCTEQQVEYATFSHCDTTAAHWELGPK
jgi:hypothetical protein